LTTFASICFLCHDVMMSVTCNMPHMQHAAHATCRTCNMPHMQHAAHATCRTCNMPYLLSSDDSETKTYMMQSGDVTGEIHAMA
jgi:hypothetical protein